MRFAVIDAAGFPRGSPGRQRKKRIGFRARMPGTGQQEERSMAARITVEKERDGEFRVTVREGATETAHRVSVDDAYHQKLTGGTVAVEDLVRHSFEFLLEREPKESILASCALP